MAKVSDKSLLRLVAAGAGIVMSLQAISAPAADAVTNDGRGIPVAAENVSEDAGKGDEITALQSRIADAPDDAALRLELARAHAADDRPAEALEACEKAAEIEPRNIEIRRLCGRYAEWAGDLEASREHFRTLLDLSPDDEEALLGAARAFGWSGRLGESAHYYRRYLDVQPDNPDAWIEYGQVRAWQGDYAAALAALEDYRDRYGETDRYREEKARYLAWDNRPREALSINTPLLEREPGNYERLYTQAVALAADYRATEAFEAIDELERLRPESKDTALLRRVAQTPYRSTARADWHYYDDSDSIRIQGAQLEARLQIGYRAGLSAGAAYSSLHADTGSDFETVGGRERIRYTRTWLGGDYRFNPAVAVSASVGDTDVSGADDFLSHEIILDLRPADGLELSLLRSRELYALSPRAVSLGIRRDHNALTLEWRPDHRYTLESILSFDDLSDGNNREELILAPRRAVLRTGPLNAALGLNLNWMRFDDDLDNGYYDPERYQRYAGTLFAYRKLGEDNGLSVVASAGLHKDDEMPDFEFGYDIVGELTLGLYKDWMSVLRVDYSDRYQETGGYDGWNIQFSITRRF
jgi:tetratricopeptide (TPR) repeat protein